MTRTALARTSIVVALATTLIGASVLFPTTHDSPVAVSAASSANFVGVTTSDLTQGLASLRAHLAQQPKDSNGWALLAEGYVEQARLTADPSLYSKAAGAVERSLALDSKDNASAFSARAALESARHEFQQALGSAHDALAINPLDPVALAIRTDALTEVGRYRRAQRSAAAMDNLRPGLSATTRLAYQAELRGHVASAAASFARAAAHSSGSDLAFALVHGANLERSVGRLGSAADLYRQALRARPEDPSALAGLARVAVARQNIPLAIDRARRVAILLPLPEHLTFLGELLLSRGQVAAAHEQFAVAEATVKLAEAQGVKVDLEQALYLADHGDPVAALEAARNSWRQRHTVHTADALGWALHVNGSDEAALKFATAANRLGTRSAQFLHHLGAIEAELGRWPSARAHLSAALNADPGYSPWQRKNVEQAQRAIAGPS